MGREAEVFASGAVGAQRGDDVRGFELFVKRGHVGAVAVERDDAAAMGKWRLDVQHGIAFIFQRWHKQRVFAEQLGGDILDANFQNQLHGSVQAYKTEQVLRASLVTASVGAENHFLLCDIIRTTDVVPAENGRMQPFLKRLADKKDSGGAWAEQPLVRVSRQ